MEAVEFLRVYGEMCDTYINRNCRGCPAYAMERCDPGDTNDKEELVMIVEKWASENSHKVTRADLDQLQNDCPAGGLENCGPEDTDERAKLVEIVEKWAKEHPDKDKTETSWEEIPLANRLMDLGEDLIATAIAREKTINSLVEPEKGVIEWAYYYVKQFLWRFYDGMDDSERSKYYYAMADIETTVRRNAPTLATTPEPEPAPKPKRTRTDVLLAAFPNAEIVDGYPPFCPTHFEKGFHCHETGVGIPCNNCKREYWLAEVEE